MFLNSELIVPLLYFASILCVVIFDINFLIPEIRIPVVLLVLNGELDTLEHVIRAIDNNISVVVVKGTGGTADLVALCMTE